MLRLTAKILPLAAGGLILAPTLAWAEAYPPQVVNQFVTSCQENFQAQIPTFANKSGAYCQCVIQELQRKLSYADFNQLANTLSPTEQDSLNQKVLVSTAQVCMARTLQ